MSEPGILPNPIPFGKYYLLERINVGGMAEVYKAKAFGVEGFERLLAVKKILSSIAEDESFINMFIDEAKIAGQLNHPNIAQIFDLGNFEGSYFIALEYIGGKDLKTIFERGRRLGEKVSIPRICYIIMKVCEGLAHAHHKKDAQGRDLSIVHRDVSPQNVLLSYEGEVKIIDFGIAKAQGKTSQTQVGILKGKFSYMSPEQVRGLHVDNRSDIFSLGIVLYELLTLERLFLGESDFDTLEKIRKVEMSPPSLYNPHIPKELEDIVLKALAKSPEERFQTASEFAEALEQFMRNQGHYFTNKDLAGYMKESFSADIEFENKKLEYYRSLNLQPIEAPASTGAEVPPRPNGAPKKPGLSWGEEEYETQIFDRDDDSIDLDVDEADIVYASKAEDDIATVDGGQWAEDGDIITLDEDGPDVDQRRRRQSTGPMPAAEIRRDPAFTLENRAVVGQKRSGPSWGLIVAIALGVAALGVALIMQFAGPKTAPITFETEPSAVQVYINGELKHDGATPFTLNIEPGPTNFEIRAAGFETFKKSQEIVADKTYNLTQRLEPEKGAAAELMVRSDPPGAKIELNGKPIESATPHTIMEPGNGPWALKFTKDGYFPEEVKLDEIPATGLAVRLKPEKISVKVTSEPSRSEYTVLDKDTEERVGNGRTPDTVRDLDASKTYVVRIKRRKYEDFSANVEPGYDAEVRVDADLEPEDSETDEPIASANAPRPDRPQRDPPDVRPKPDKPNKPDKPDPEPDEPDVKPDKPKKTGTGRLTIGSKPTARVYINGKDTGKYTPLLNVEMKAGKHKINLVNPDFGLNKTYYVEIEPGDSKKIINK